MLAVSIFIALFLLLTSKVVRQAVTIWRVFHADLAICAPYLSADQEEQLRAEFAAMHAKADYLKIALQLETIAKEHNVALRTEELW